jgi:hypothetical protein
MEEQLHDVIRPSPRGKDGLHGNIPSYQEALLLSMPNVSVCQQLVPDGARARAAKGTGTSTGTGTGTGTELMLNGLTCHRGTRCSLMNNQ